MIYGDNNINQTHYKEVDIRLVSMSNTDVRKTFCFSQDEMNNILNELKLDKSKFNEWNDNLYKLMVLFRDDLRGIQMRSKMNYITMLNKYQLPVNMARIVEDAKNAVVSTKQERLSPLYIIHAINYILKSNVTKINIIDKGLNENSFKFNDQNRAKYIFKIALYEYLSPRRCIFEYKLTKPQFDLMVIEIIKSFRKACIEPGEMVGVLTAQTLGEVLTQMSITNESIIHIKVKNNKNNKINIKKVKIGEFIDTLYKQFPQRVIDIPEHKDSTEFSLKGLSHEYYVCGVDPKTEKVNWNRISHLSRHPTNGNLLKIKTQSGRTITSTKSHNFLKRTADNGIVAVTSKDLRIKDRIPVARNIKYQMNNKSITIDDFKLNLSEKMGWLFGAYLAEGYLNGIQIDISNVSEEYYNNIYNLGKELDVDIKQRKYQGEYGPGIDTSFRHKELSDIISTHFKTGSFNKVIPEFVHNANIDFVKGLLRGYFDGAASSHPGMQGAASSHPGMQGDGNVASDRHLIRVGSRSKQLIEDVALLLSYFGIFASKYSETKKDNDTPLYCLGIPHKYARTFLESIGSDFESKRNGIKSIIEYSLESNAFKVEPLAPTESEHKSNTEVIDRIPELGHIIARVSSTLKMEGNSRTYGAWHRKNLAIGRVTLKICIDKFEEKAIETNKLDEVRDDIEYLKMIYNGDVVWDEITEITEIDDPKEYVYDFTIPKNETFMVNDGIIVHNTLNTFHSSGVGVKGMQGIPRFREILSYSKNIQTPYMIIKLIQEVKEDQNIANKVQAYLKHTTFENVVERMDIIYDPYPNNILTKDNINSKNVYFVNGSNVSIDNLPWLFRFTISRESMLENDITLLDIKTKFIKYWNEYNNDTSSGKKKIVLNKVTNGCIMSNFDNSETPYIHIRFNINNPDNYSLIEIGQYLLNKISIKGVDTIEKVDSVNKQKVIDYDSDFGIKQNSNEWVMYTTGIDLNKIKTIKFVDFYSAYINDIYTAYLNFGIEAARQLIILESDKLYGGSGNDINITHLALLADVMTNTGNITSIDRHGINRLDTDPLSRASFEKTVEQLLVASAFNEVDYMRSVSSRIMAGRCIKGGTGICDVLMDNEKLENTEQTGREKSFTKVSGLELEENVILQDVNKHEDDIFIP
jgi:DNA-directed RNA polymerase subunit A"